MFKEKLKKALCEKNFLFTEEKLIKFEEFYQMLLEWNKKFNLTRIVDEDDFITKHILDSLAALNVLSKNSVALDVGAGAGFPSIPLSIMDESLKITMIDSVGKKVSFLQHVIYKLDLKNSAAIHARVEDYAKENREKFDFVLSRAVASLPTLLEYCLPFIKTKGRCLFYKTQNELLLQEIKSAQSATKILNGFNDKNIEYTLGESRRILMVFGKHCVTSLHYPRGRNLPRKCPL